MLPVPVSRTARKRPSASSASSATFSWSRPWLSERKLAERSSVHLTGRPSSARGMQQADIFGIGLRLHAEGAADIAGERRAAWPAARRGSRRAGRAGRTRPGSPTWKVKRSLLRHRRTAIAARGSMALTTSAVVDEREPRHMRGLGEGRLHLLGVAIVIVERDIVGHVVEQLRRAGLDRRRWRVVTAGSGSMSSDDRFGRVLRLRSRVSAITQATGSPTKRTLSTASAGRGGLFIGVPSRFLSGGTHLSAAIAGRLQVGPGIDGEHARHRARRRGVDAPEHAMGMARPHDRRIGLAAEGSGHRYSGLRRARARDPRCAAPAGRRRISPTPKSRDHSEHS